MEKEINTGRLVIELKMRKSNGETEAERKNRLMLLGREKIKKNRQRRR